MSVGSRSGIAVGGNQHSGRTPRAARVGVGLECRPEEELEELEKQGVIAPPGSWVAARPSRRPSSPRSSLPLSSLPPSLPSRSPVLPSPVTKVTPGPSLGSPPRDPSRRGSWAVSPRSVAGRVLGCSRKLKVGAYLVGSRSGSGRLLPGAGALASTVAGISPLR